MNGVCVFCAAASSMRRRVASSSLWLVGAGQRNRLTGRDDMNAIIFRLFCVSVAVIVGGAVGGADVDSPYGVCAHVSREWWGDHQTAEQQFALMRQAGIGWARTDFDWSGVQRQQGGPWDFSLLERTVQMAEDGGITLLPILAYDVPWASPAYRHLELWREYVRRTVGHFKGRLRYWEVWNEPDLEPFWKDRPNPANYTRLLKAAYEEIKAVDPEAVVLLGGLSGIPMEFIEGIYQAGGGAYFDVMNVHPYRYPQIPEAPSLSADLRRLRELMAEYGDADKPVWITEIGWPTHHNDTELLADIVRAGLKTLRPNRPAWTLAVLDDPGYVVRVPISDAALQAMLPGQGRVERLTLAQIERLTPTRHDALLLPLDEGFPRDVFDTIEAYVRDGGTVIFGHGVPLYYTRYVDSDGRWQRGDAGGAYRQRLRIGWEAWWTREGVPQSIDTLTIPAAYAASIRPAERVPAATRFVTDALLGPEDRFIPLVQASKDDYTGTAAAVLDLSGTMTGSVLVSALQGEYRGILEDQQAVMLSRAYVIALHSGVERMFWYNLRARENDPYYNEDHFGIVHRDLSPKPAYRALQALNRARPTGSKPLAGDWQDGPLYYPGWRRPDGQTVWAVWTIGPAARRKVRWDGRIDEAFDHLGRKVQTREITENGTLSVRNSILYLVGPERVYP